MNRMPKAYLRIVKPLQRLAHTPLYVAYRWPFVWLCVNNLTLNDDHKLGTRGGIVSGIYGGNN